MGKTTRAAGLAIRAAGEGLRVAFIQFMKSGKSGEVKILSNLANISFFCPGPHPFILSKGPEEVHFRHARDSYSMALKAAQGSFHLLICDEILNTLIFGLLGLEEILQLIGLCKNRMDLVITGRNAPPEVIELADYVTQFVQIKHPYYEGYRARKGIEY